MLKRLKSYIGNRSPIRIFWHKSKAFLAAVRYGFPARKLKVIGITGTDGKTTTVGMTAHILSKNGIRCGELSTAYIRIGDDRHWNETQKTSPDPFVIQKFLRDCIEADCTHVVLECSSHGLVQGRLIGIHPAVAAITNTSEEHLDYHGSMQQYRKDKSILFRMLQRKGTKVLNHNDETFNEYNTIKSQKTISYSGSTNDATLTLSEIEVSPKKSHATIHSKDTDEIVNLNLNIPGRFNLENALCAIGCTISFCSLKEVCKALETFEGIAGRLEDISEGQNFSLFVDFTVTPSSYTKTLTTLRQMIPEGKRILVVTGSCGDRMVEKRPIVGRICSELADVVVVTNEDPYTEDPQKIIDEVWAGINQDTCTAKQIFDRREAIEWATHEANEGDVIILCAKGSDTTMWVADGQIPWNEREVAREVLRAL